MGSNAVEGLREGRGLDERCVVRRVGKGSTTPSQICEAVTRKGPKAHRLLYHSTLGWRVMKRKKKKHLLGSDAVEGFREGCSRCAWGV